MGYFCEKPEKMFFGGVFKVIFENTGGQRYSLRKMARLLVGAEFGRLSGYIEEDIEEKKTMEFVLEDDL